MEGGFGIESDELATLPPAPSRGQFPPRFVWAFSQTENRGNCRWDRTRWWLESLARARAPLHGRACLAWLI